MRILASGPGLVNVVKHQSESCVRGFKLPSPFGSVETMELSMKQLIDDVYILEGFPPYAINVYLLGEVLVDAGTRFAAKRILRRLRGRTVSTHALTHAHPDHQGSSHAICESLGIPLWCGDADAEPWKRLE